MKKLIPVLSIFIALSAGAETVHELKIVRQVYNINADNPEHIYQFIPDYLEIKKGDTVRFLGTVGRHTVHSVKRMLPEGAEKIRILPRGERDVKFDVPGIYGIKCQIHQRHGMVAVVVVGGDLHNMEEARQGASKSISAFSRPKMHRLLDKAEASLK